MTEAQRENWPAPKWIATLHAAGYSNEKIGYLLPQYGPCEPASERTVRRWAMRETEPSLSQGGALEAFSASLNGNSAKTPIEVQQE